MAKIRDYAVTINSADTTPVVCEMPTHVTGDLLIAICGKDGTAVFNTPANWYSASSAASTGAYGSIFTKRAASGAETLSITLATTDASVVVVLAIEGQYWDGVTTNGSDALSTAVTLAAIDNTSPYTAGTVVPAHNNSLVISALYSDATFSIHPSAGWPIIFTGDSGTNSLSICYTQQKTAASITGPTWTPGTGAADDTRTWMIAIRDGSSNALCDAYLDRGTVPAYLLSRLNGSATGDINTPAYIAAASATLTSVLVGGSTSKTCTGVTWGTATADSAYDPYGTSSLQPGASSTANFSLSECTFSSWNLTQGKGLIFGMFQPTLPRDYVDLGKVSTGGVAINLTSGSTANARAWVIGGQFDKTTVQANYNPFVIQVQQSSNTAYAWNSTVTWSGVTRVGFLTQGYYGAASLRWQGFHVLNVAVLAGGTPTNPFNLNDVTRVVNRGSGNIPLISQAGSSITSMIPLQFGGGDPCAVDINLGSIQFPTATVTDADYRNFHVDANYVGIEFYGLTSSDLLSFTNTVFTSGTSYYWRFNASHSSNAVIDFTGSSVINATVTLQSSVTLNSVNFINCSTFTQNSAVLNKCNFTNTKVISSSPTVMASITNSTFTSVGTGYAIEVGSATAVPGSPLSITFTGNTFTGYASSNGSTGNEAIHVLYTSGTLTIDVAGGGTSPSIHTAGATVIVNNTKVLTITGLITGSDIVIKTSDTNVSLVNVDANSGSTYGYNYVYSAGTYVDIKIQLAGYKPVQIYDYLLADSNASLPIAQEVDRAYI